MVSVRDKCVFIIELRIYSAQQHGIFPCAPGNRYILAVNGGCVIIVYGCPEQLRPKSV